jgi:phosphoribosylformylglycinamidine synthase
MIAGSSTGRDGIHGATFASEEISPKSEAKRPSVQVGDPFAEKLLLEATLEVIRSGYVIGIQDMGAAGITCSTSEMSAKGKCGMQIDLENVPTRESRMTAYEIMLSESQERMLIVVSPENERKVIDVFEKWDLDCKRIGIVTGDGILTVRHNGEVKAQIPSECLVLGGGAPVYSPPSLEPAYLKGIRELNPMALHEPSDYNEVLFSLLSSGNICSREWIHTQYDAMVRTNTVVNGGDAAVIRVKGTSKAIALKTDCNPRYAFLNPRRGAQIAVAESARNVVCCGAKPVAITNCLNFGNPSDPEVFWQFKEVVQGISEACAAMDTPVTGGNVSFYNEGPKGAIYPTPVIGMLGEISSLDDITTSAFKQSGDLIILLGETNSHLGGSEYLHVIHKLVKGDAPAINLGMEKRLHECCHELIRSGKIRSAHDLSEGGLAVAIAECSIAAHQAGTLLGARIEMTLSARADFEFFGEDQSRIIITAAHGNVQAVMDICRANGIMNRVIGEVIPDVLQLNEHIDVEVVQLADRYCNSLRRRMESVDGGSCGEY